MKITLNGTPQTVQATTLAEALAELGYGGEKLATAVNEVFVPATARASCVLHAGDRVEVVAPRQGG
ncbi:sulfur carrier protein ThiS [Fertoebacter nigrum]|uniref:Sulfur carrier protein ThiS n=1 Tax=Fertoeibacter niger TaxID=2656921 RepID=A0A8X8H0Z4_9RHOB|nr:sulfur carrier protein ThiS [Fertoeibacter niger]NUB45553.1 sulfur carrier protein ThiS [Fertoeibacter niger]